jgi:DNA helicase-2/ATP-dependent DNA helicase PcrA
VLTRYLTVNAPRLSEVELVEKPIEVEMDGAVTVSGRIDLVVRRSDDQVAVVDLKSTHRAQAEALTETQLRLYALGYEALTGQWPARTEIWELDALETHAGVVDRSVIDEVQAQVRTVADKIRRADFEANPEASRCAGCSLRGLCAHRSP